MSMTNGNRDGAAPVVNGRAAAATAGPVAETLAEHAESVARAVRILSRMEREGTLEELADLLTLVKLMKDALTDDMVVGLVRRAEGLAGAATDPALTELLQKAPGAVRAAQAAAARTAEPPGVMGLLKEMRDPQVRRGLAFLLSLVKHLAPQP